MSQESATDYSSDLNAVEGYNHVADDVSLWSRVTNKPGPNSDEPNVPNVPSGSVEDVAKNCSRAVEKLRNFDLDKFFQDQDKPHWEDLGALFLDILIFFDIEATGRLFDERNQQYVQCIASIFDVAFLRFLLEICRRLLQTAFHSKVHGSRQMLVCYVEAFFASLPHFLSCLAGGQQSEWHAGKQGERTSFLLHGHGEDDLRVSCQLPQRWQQFPALLQSGQASPASKRLALGILFAAFVMRPELEDCDPWMETSNDIKPKHVVACLDTLLEEFVVQARNLTLSDNNPVILTLRTAYAMAVVLFASAEVAARCHEGYNSAVFEPHTSACLLELISLILSSAGGSSSLVPQRNLDVPQAILLHWGATIPWAWERWDDPRVIGFNTIAVLTSNWLYHLDGSLSMTLWDEHAQAKGDGPLFKPCLALALSRAVQANPRTSLVALSYQICDESGGKGLFDWTDDAYLLRLHRATWCLSELIGTCGDLLSRDDLSFVTVQLVLLFAVSSEFYGVRGSKVKEEIIRCLKSLRSDVRGKAFLSFHRNVSFFTKIATAIGKASRMVTGDPTGRFLLEPGVPNGLSMLLDLIALFYKSNAAKCLPTSTFTLFSDLVKFLSQCVGTTGLRIALLDCLAYAHGLCQERQSEPVAESNEGLPIVNLHKTWHDEDAYDLALNMVGTNVDLTAVFASYVTLTVKKSTDVLLMAETWHYLCDVLHILATGQLQGFDQEFGHAIIALERNSADRKRALKLVAATEKICAALEAVLKRSDAAVARLLLGSPATISLHNSLQRIRKPVQREVTKDIDPGCSASRGTPEMEEVAKLHGQVSKTREKFLEKLKKFETDLNK